MMIFFDKKQQIDDPFPWFISEKLTISLTTYEK